MKSLKIILASAQTFFSIWFNWLFKLPPTQLPLVYFDITDRCNSNCRYCIFGAGRSDEIKAEVTTEQVTGIIPALKRLKTRVISIGGGECTLRDDLEHIISRFEENGIKVILHTNATNLPQERIDSLINSGLRFVYISYDHSDPEGYKDTRGVDRHEEVEKAIDYLRQKNVSVAINVVVSLLNFDVLDTIVEKCLNWQVHKLQFIPVNNHLQHANMEKDLFDNIIPNAGQLEKMKRKIKELNLRLQEKNILTNSSYFAENYEKAYLYKKDVPCMGGYAFVQIEADGEVKPCYANSSHLNIKDQALDVIIKQKEYRDALKEVRSCHRPCLDSGSAEPSIRLMPHYLIKNIAKTIRETISHLR